MRHFRIYLLTVLLAGSLASFAFADDFSSTNFTVKDPVIAEPAAYGTSSNYGLWGTIPNIASEPGVSSNFGVNPGFLAFTGVTMPTLSATASTTELDLTWTAAVSPSSVYYEPGYSLALGGPYTFSATQTLQLATVSGLTADTAYYLIIRVTEQSGGALLGYSNELAISTLSDTPAPAQDSDTGGSASGSAPQTITTVWVVTTTGLVRSPDGEGVGVLLPGESITIAPPLFRQFGYVVYVEDNTEIPIPDAEVQLWRFNERTGLFELWPNNEAALTHTDATGLYSYMIPAGRYQLRTEIPGYVPYLGPMAVVDATGDLEQRVELVKKMGINLPWLLLTILLLASLALAILVVLLMIKLFFRR